MPEEAVKFKLEKPLNNSQKAIVRRWIKALRSGLYSKGYGALFDGNSHCALGVRVERRLPALTSLPGARQAQLTR